MSHHPAQQFIRPEDHRKCDYCDGHVSHKALDNIFVAGGILVHPYGKCPINGARKKKEKSPVQYRLTSPSSSSSSYSSSNWRRRPRSSRLVPPQTFTQSVAQQSFPLPPPHRSRDQSFSRGRGNLRERDIREIREIRVHRRSEPFVQHHRNAKPYRSQERPRTTAVMNPYHADIDRRVDTHERHVHKKDNHPSSKGYLVCIFCKGKMSPYIHEPLTTASGEMIHPRGSHCPARVTGSEPMDEHR